MTCEKCGADVMALVVREDLPVLCSECIDEYYKTQLNEDEPVREWIKRTKQ